MMHEERPRTAVVLAIVFVVLGICMVVERGCSEDSIIYVERGSR